MQDTRKNKFNQNEKELRYYAQFPLFHYGFLPQTHESQERQSADGLKGDNDPLDVCDLSSHNTQIGQIYQVNILGCFCLIDQGEIDWKILSIEQNEAKAKNINTLKDLEKLYPYRLESIKNWFKYIKTFDGKKANTIHYNETIFEREKALEVIKENHEDFKLTFKNEQLYVKYFLNKN